MDAGGAPVVTLERPRPADVDRPAFVSAQVLPGRGMMTLQIRAHLPGQGETDLLAAPPLERAREVLDGEEDFKGNSSYFFGAAVLLPFANRIRGSRAGGVRGLPGADRAVHSLRPLYGV